MEAAEQVADLVRHPEKVPPLRPSQVWCDRVPEVTKWFTGRDELLTGLTGTRPAAGTRVLTQTVNGMGGVGKTTVAAAFAEAQRHALDIVWWVRAEDPVTLTVDLAELGDRIGLPAGGEEDPMVRGEAVRAWLEETSRSWLVVFDNAVDVAAVERWRPKRGGGAVLVTSRNREFDRIGDVVDVGVFSLGVAEQFLRDRVMGRNPAAADEEAARTVAARLGGLPLALEQAASWVVQAPHRRFSRYVELFDDASREPFPEGTRPVGYEATAWSTWRVSIDTATEQAPLAGRVMAALGYVAPEDLPLRYLLNEIVSLDDYLVASVDEVEAAVVALHTYSLVEIADGTLGVHRVVQAAARRQGDAAAAAFAVRMLHAQTAGDADNHVNWPQLKKLAPHAIHVADHAGIALPEIASELWWVLDDIATYLRASGQVAAAITLAERAQGLATLQFGDEHPDTLESRNTLAGAYRAAGQLARAIALYEAVLTARRRVLGDDHPNTLASRNNLAGAYQSAGRLEEATALLKAVLTDSRRVLGDDHPETLNSRNNLASAYHAAGQLARAIPLYEAVLTARRRVLGDDHPDTLNSRNNLAYAYHAAGQLARAIPLYAAVLTARRRVLGDDHPDTLNSRNNLAVAYQEAGQLDVAISELEAVLTARRRVLGDDHPDTLNSRNNLAYAYHAAGQLARAIPLYAAVLTDSQRVLGDDHPNTLGSRSNLAGAYQSTGRLEEATALLKAVLTARRRVLGDDHPNTLNSRNNLAGAYQSAGQLARAIALYEAVLSDSRRVLGDDHPDTLESRNNLAYAYRDNGQWDVAISELEAAVASSRRTMSPSHELAQTLVSNLAAMREEATGRPSPAGGPISTRALSSRSSWRRRSSTKRTR